MILMCFFDLWINQAMLKLTYCNLHHHLVLLTLYFHYISTNIPLYIKSLFTNVCCDSLRCCSPRSRCTKEQRRARRARSLQARPESHSTEERKVESLDIMKGLRIGKMDEHWEKNIGII